MALNESLDLDLNLGRIDSASLLGSLGIAEAEVLAGFGGETRGSHGAAMARTGAEGTFFLSVGSIRNIEQIFYR